MYGKKTPLQMIRDRAAPTAAGNVPPHRVPCARRGHDRFDHTGIRPVQDHCVKCARKRVVCVFEADPAKVGPDPYGLFRTGVWVDRYGVVRNGDGPAAPRPKACECGSEKVGSPRHSGWCPRA